MLRRSLPRRAARADRHGWWAGREAQVPVARGLHHEAVEVREVTSKALVRGTWATVRNIRRGPAAYRQPGPGQARRRRLSAGSGHVRTDILLGTQHQGYAAAVVRNAVCLLLCGTASHVAGTACGSNPASKRVGAASTSPTLRQAATSCQRACGRKAASASYAGPRWAAGPSGLAATRLVSALGSQKCVQAPVCPSQP